MKYKVVLKVKENQYLADLQKNQTPSEIAFDLANRLDYAVDTPKYVCFVSSENGGEYLFEARKISGILNKHCLIIDNLYQLYNINLGKDKNILAQGNSVYDVDENGFSGYFPLPENMCYMCMGAYPLGKIGGNHYHYRKVEYLYSIEGKFNVKIQLVNDASKNVELTLAVGQMLRLLPGVKHWVTPIGETAKFIELSPNMYDEKDYL